MTGNDLAAFVALTTCQDKILRDKLLCLETRTLDNINKATRQHEATKASSTAFDSARAAFVKKTKGQCKQCRSRKHTKCKRATDTCYFCRRTGHKKEDCRSKRKRTC